MYISESPDSLIQASFIALPPETRVQVAIDAMAEARVSCVLVLEAEQLVGILTERDVVRLTTQSELQVKSTLAATMTADVVTLNLAETRDAFALTRRFRDHGIRHLPVVDDQHKVVGIVTPYSLRRALKPEYLLRHLRVAEVLQPDVIHGFPESSVWELSAHMTQHRVSCVVILDSQARMPIGIVTERDIVKFHRLGLDVKAISAQKIMSSPLSTVAPSDSLWSVHEKMMALRVRRLVVTHASGELAGIVTQTQLLKVLDPVETHRVMAQMQVLIDHQTQELKRLNQELKRSNTTLRHLTTVDELTQIANRRRLNNFLQEEWERLMIQKKPISLVMCDVDDFKAYNDTYGHLAGDRCLIQIAEALLSVTWASSDLVARYGGEEFVVVLPNADGAAAENIAKKIQAQVAALNLSHSGSSVAEQITLSMGVISLIPEHQRSPVSMLNVADQLLYQAKQQGRNRYTLKVLTSPGSPPEGAPCSAPDSSTVR